MVTALSRGELDIIVGMVPHKASRADPRSRLVHDALYEESLSVVVGSAHAPARRRRVQLAVLHRLDWILPIPDSAAYPSVQALFQNAGVSLPRRRVESVSILTNLGLLTHSDAVALLPQAAAE